MAGLKGNVAWVALGKQPAKGTPATDATDKLPFAGGSVQPTREVGQLSETDASRNQGVSFVQTTGVEGTPEVYVRDASIHHVLEAALGTLGTSGAGPNYTHTVTPATNLPYYTLWRNVGNTLYERFEDVMVSELTISAEAGQPLTAAINVMGRRASRSATAYAGTVLAGAVASGAVYNYNEAVVTLGGGATSLISSFELTITNNVTTQQTDDSVPYDVVAGMFEVTLSFDLIFETLDEYNKFHYGGAAGTAISATIFTTTANFAFNKGANNDIAFDFPALAYEEFPVDPDAGGDPIVVPVRARAQRSASPFVTAVVKNQSAT